MGLPRSNVSRQSCDTGESDKLLSIAMDLHRTSAVEVQVIRDNNAEVGVGRCAILNQKVSAW